MSEINPRYLQILTILYRHPDGMTNRQILDYAMTMRPNELPDDMSIMAVNAQALRRRGDLTTTDICGQKIHRITAQGMKYVFAPDQINNETPKQPAAETVKTPEQSVERVPAGTKQHIDDITAQICRLIGLIEHPDSLPKIKNKKDKIELLEMFINCELFEPWITDLVDEIKTDLQKLESADD